jgi:hypothetical protein
MAKKDKAEVLDEETGEIVEGGDDIEFTDGKKKPKAVDPEKEWANMTVPDLFESYKVHLRLLHNQLGTNPQNLNVMDNHIIERQRKLIADKSSINKALNKYAGEKDITPERKIQELEALALRTEELLGRELTEEEFEALRVGKIDKFEALKETLEELETKGITCFFRMQDEEGQQKIAIGSHMIKGFLKSAAEALCRTISGEKSKGTVMSSTAYTHSIINTHLAVYPDLIAASKDIMRDENGLAIYDQRSLRANTAKGPRVSLAKSEILPAGTEYIFEIQVLKNSPLRPQHLLTLFTYG